jgi:hypothetical protein
MELAVIAYRFATDAQFALDLKERFQETLATLGLHLSAEEENAVRLLLPRLQTSLAGVDGINILNAEPWAI